MNRKTENIIRKSSRSNGPLFQRIREHPRLPFAEIEFDVAYPGDGSGPFRVHLFNEATYRVERWLEQLEVLMKKDNKRLKGKRRAYSDDYLPGIPGHLPIAKHLGEVEVDEYRLFGETVVSCPCIGLVAILVDQVSQNPIGVTTFGLGVYVGSKSNVRIEAKVFYVWLSSSHRGKKLSTMMSDVVATSLVRYHGFLNDGFEGDEAPHDVDFEITADADSASGHAFLADCGRSFKRQCSKGAPPSHLRPKSYEWFAT